MESRAKAARENKLVDKDFNMAMDQYLEDEQMNLVMDQMERTRSNVGGNDVERLRLGPGGPGNASCAQGGGGAHNHWKGGAQGEVGVWIRARFRGGPSGQGRGPYKM